MSTSTMPYLNVINNHALFDAKYRVNKFEENLLSKQLEKLNIEEMKSRVKHHRMSTELILFLRNCKKTTGYFEKSKQLESFGKPSESSLRNFIDIESIESQLREKSLNEPKKYPTFKRNEMRMLLDSKKFNDKSSFVNPSFRSSSVITNSTSSSTKSSNCERKILVKSIDHFDYSKEPIKVSNELRNDQNKQASLNARKINDTSSNNVARLNREKVRPMTCNVVKTRRFQAASNLNDRNTVSNLDWFTTTVNFDELSDKKSLPKATNEKVDDLQLVKELDYASTTTSSFNFSSCASILTKAKPKMSKNVLFQKVPIKIRMTRKTIKKKQSEIMNEYDRLNSMDMFNNFRQTQKSLNEKVKMFSLQSEN